MKLDELGDLVVDLNDLADQAGYSGPLFELRTTGNYTSILLLSGLEMWDDEDNHAPDIVGMETIEDVRKWVWRQFAVLSKSFAHAKVLASTLAGVPASKIDIVFDGPPGPEGPRFIEVEDGTGKSIGVGEWVERKDGYWALRIPDPR